MKRGAFLLLFAIGCKTSPPPVEEGGWRMFGSGPDRNGVSSETGLPATWTEKDVRWVVNLGEQTWSNPVISNGRIFIGTNNGKPRDPAVKGDRGIFMCFSEADGSFLWQAVHDKLAQAEDNANIGVVSTPCVVGDRVYYVSNRAELVCCDAQGFTDGENDGPFQGETRAGEQDADFIWILDMRKDLGVSPFSASASSPLVIGGRVFVLTGQGRNKELERVENPDSPSFISVDAKTGRVVWQDNSPGGRIIWGQWGSPAYGVVDGVPQVVFPGGDAWLYAFEPETGKLLWKFNCKAHEKLDDEGKPETESTLLATPVYAGHRVFAALGIDTCDTDVGCLRAIDARKRGDVTKTAELWRVGGKDFESSLGSVVVHEGLVYAVEQAGYLHCIDVETGKRIWRHDLLSTIYWGPTVADGKVYVRNADGEVLVMKAGREMKVLETNTTLKGLSAGTVVAANGALYLAGHTKLYCISGD